MAEIHIQRKRKNLWWLWVIILLVIAAVVYYLYINNYFNTGGKIAANLFILPTAFNVYKN